MAGQIIGARFSDAEIQQIAAIATQLGIKKSDYIKSLALNAANRESAALAESRASIERVAEALEALTQSINALIAVPSFREFRIRLTVENVPLPSDPAQAVIAAARMYHAQYKVWPDPSESSRFGAIPQGMNFPKGP